LPAAGPHGGDLRVEGAQVSWKELIVHIKNDEAQEPYLQITTQLARRFSARATGIFPLPDLALMRHVLDRVSDESAIQQYVREAYERAERYEARFRQAMQRSSVDCDWRTGEGDPAQIMVLAGRVADLIVIEQRKPQVNESAWDVPETVALSSGTPTLVVPHSRSFGDIGKRILIAWNGGREAARAISSALPLLDAADSIVVLNGLSKEQFTTVTRRPQLHVRRRLMAHCANVEVADFQPRSGEEGTEILSSAQAHGCDLIVMGAYGHSRVRELLLGGATREIFRNMDRPVLFAH
jgi:nucleotide-binding universal stress UspA family protein